MGNFLYKNKDLLILVLIHILVINSFVHLLIIGPLLLTILLVTCGSTAEVLFNYYDTDMILVCIIILLIILSYIVKCTILPIVYSYFERNSKNVIVKTFICNLKNNWKWRIGVLVLAMLLPFNIYQNTNNDLVQIVLLHIFVMSFFVSYLTLYLWWDVKNLVTKNKENKTKIL